MKNLICLLGLGCQLLSAQVFTTQQILNSGPNANRINVAILGDGYTSTQLGSFVTAAQNSSNYLFTKTPFKEYKNYFNVFAVQVVSAQSGVKHPGTATDVTEPVIPVSNPNNFLGSSFDIGFHRCLYSNSTNKVAQVLASNVPDYDVAYVLGNSTEYGGCGGSFAFSSVNSLANEIVVHEMGHTFGQLADEYWFAGTGESANKTQTSNPSTIRWKNWLNSNSVGIYPHAESPTWYRPHQNCEMRYLGQQFCSVCKEAFIERIHQLVSPIDSYTPNNNATLDATQPINFSVTTILPVPNTLSYTWKLNGSTLAGTSNQMTINPAQLNSGNNTLIFSVTDNTDMVRTTNHSTLHVRTLSWTLNKSTAGVENVGAKEYGFTIYPNPVNDRLLIKTADNIKGNLDFKINDASGKLIPLKVEKMDEYRFAMDLGSMPKGTYMIHVYKDRELILSHKVIKE